MTKKNEKGTHELQSRAGSNKKQTERRRQPSSRRPSKRGPPRTKRSRRNAGQILYIMPRRGRSHSAQDTSDKEDSNIQTKRTHQRNAIFPAWEKAKEGKADKKKRAENEKPPPETCEGLNNRSVEQARAPSIQEPHEPGKL